MEITPVGFIYLFITVMLVISKKPLANLLIFCAITDIFIETGHLASYGNSKEIFYNGFTQIILFLYCLSLYVQKSFRLSFVYILLNLCYIIPIILLLIFPSNVLVANGVNGIWDSIMLGNNMAVRPSVTGGVILYSRRFVYASFIAFFVYKKFKNEDYLYTLEWLSKLINVFIIIGVIEFFIKNVFGLNTQWGEMTEFLLGSTNSAFYEGRLRGNIYELSLFTRETSHYAFSLFLCLIINLVTNIQRGKKNGIDIYTCLLIILLLFTTSFSSVLFIFGFLSLYLLYRWGVLHPVTMKFEMPILFITLVLGLPVFISLLFENKNVFVIGRLFNMFENYNSFLTSGGVYNDKLLGDWSAFIRIYSVEQTLNAFLSRPLFGLSLGAAFCHGATAMLLSGIGVVGVFILIKFYFFDSLYKKYDIKKFLYCIAIFLYLLINLYNSKELLPFCDSTLIVIVICFTIIFSNNSFKYLKLNNF